MKEEPSATVIQNWRKNNTGKTNTEKYWFECEIPFPKMIDIFHLELNAKTINTDYENVYQWSEFISSDEEYYYNIANKHENKVSIKNNPYILAVEGKISNEERIIMILKNITTKRIFSGECYYDNKDKFVGIIQKKY